MRPAYSLFAAYVLASLAWASCASPEADTNSPNVESPVVTTGGEDVVPPPPLLNERVGYLVDGYWHVATVFEREPSPRYQSQLGHFYRFEPNGSYAQYDSTGVLAQAGQWSYERRGNRQHFITLDADGDYPDDEFRFHLNPRSAVFIGTERSGNTSVQMRVNQRPDPPVPIR